MIEKLRGIAIFATVVDQGTFRAAAQHLGLAPSRVSETISDLEKDLGVTLLYRSTRQLSMSQEGRVLYEKAQDMLKAAESGLDMINPNSTEKSGILRVTAPAFVTQTDLMDVICNFARTYPNIRLSLDFSDRTRDLIKDGFDIGIRAGWLKDSELLTRNIGKTGRMLVGSPDYIATRPTAKHPNDLADWDWIHFSLRSNQTEFVDQNRQSVEVSGSSNLTVNSADSLYEFAARGLGITAIPANLARRGIARGDLVHLLPDWTLKPLGLHAVWPNQSSRENITRLFVRFIVADNLHNDW
ncbi:MAG: LysR family transcriptional regulator [Pseudomonadota bacterium]